MELADAQKDAAALARKAMFVGVLALLLAGACGWILARFGRHGPQMQDVVVAAQDLTALTRLKAKYFKVVPWPLESLPQGTFKQPDDILKAYEVNLVDIVAGEPVLAAHVSTLARGLGVSQLVEPSMRAYVIEVHEALAKSHMIHPGAMVDVVATIDSSRGSANPVTKVILQNVQVLAIGDSVSLDQVDNKTNNKDNEQDSTRTEKHRVVTLLVGLGDVEYLAFAASQGKLDLALRNNTDTEIIPTTGVDTAKVFGKRIQEIPEPVARPNVIAPPVPRPVSNTSGSHTHSGTGHSRQIPATNDDPTIYKVRH